jgi:hypothetical protein
MRTSQFVESSNYRWRVQKQHRQAEVAPLTAQEEAAWRALARAVLVIPRMLDAEMLESQGLNITEYNVLMNLSEAPDHSLRMSELANFVSITVSGLTRVVERLSRRGLVERARRKRWPRPVGGAHARGSGAAAASMAKAIWPLSADTLSTIS